MELTNTIDTLNEIGTEGLLETFGISASQNEKYPNLYVLNYSQIDSHKYRTHPVVCECRSLLVERSQNNWRLLSRSFDRFFNWGEVEYNGDVTKLRAYEKIDGSLVSVSYYEGEWLYRTKSMLMPAENMRMATGRSWKELIESCIIGPFNLKDHTYIFEIVSRDNRVVTKYDNDTAYLLAVRNNESGEYLSNIDYGRELKLLQKTSSRIQMPRIFEFNTIEKCLESVNELPNLEEGYVMVDHNNVPVIKLKSLAYVAAHRLRGECTPTPKRIVEMIRINEVDEYLSIFPEDSEMFGKWITAREHIEREFKKYNSHFSEIQDQKAFAQSVLADCPHLQGFLFTARKKSELFDFTSEFNQISISKAVNLLEHYVV